MIVTGTGDGEVKLFSIDQDELAKGMQENEQGELPNLISSLGPLSLPTPLPTTASVSQLAFHPTLPFLMLQSSDKALTVLRIRELDEVAQKKARRRKRDREKGRVEEDDSESAPKWEERVTSWCVVRAGGKIRSFAFGDDEASGPKNAVQVLLALSNNALETHAIPLPGPGKPSKTAAGADPEPSKTHTLELHGHRQDVRTMCLSSDDQVLASASNGALLLRF
jgi:U3 small nucleolar RNA-associated protein 12